MQIYNIQINPELAKLAIGKVRLVATRHAQLRAEERGMKLPTFLLVEAGTIVELEAEGRKIKKLVVRIAGAADQDNCYVLWNQFGDLWSILSCYQNSHSDKHTTLNTRRFV